MKELSLSEVMFLLVILRLEGSAYGVSIRDELRKMFRRDVPYGTLYSYLDQLFRKGLVAKSFGAPTGERGGRHKILYRVSPGGREALTESYRLQKDLCRGLEDYVGDKE